MSKGYKGYPKTFQSDVYDLPLYVNAVQESIVELLFELTYFIFPFLAVLLFWMKTVDDEVVYRKPNRLSQISIELAAEAEASSIRIPSRASTIAHSPIRRYSGLQDLEKSDNYLCYDNEEDELSDSERTHDSPVQKLFRLVDFKSSLHLSNILRDLAREEAHIQRQSVSSVWSAGELSANQKQIIFEADQNRNLQFSDASSTCSSSDGSQTLVNHHICGIDRQLSHSNGRKKLLLIRLCKAMVRYGAPSHRIESSLEKSADYLNIPTTAIFLPGLTIICFSDTKHHTIETLMIKCAEGFDMGKLAQVYDIANAMQESKIDVQKALEQLHEIKLSPPTWGIWAKLIAYTVSSFVAAPTMFQGSWMDSLVSGSLGLLVGIFVILAERYSTLSNVIAVATCILIGFIVRSLSPYICFTGVVLASIVILLPGYSLTISIMELSSQHMITGTVRFGYSLLYSLFIGYGLEIGSSLYTAIDPGIPSDFATCNNPVSEWVYIPLFPIVAIATGMTFGARVRQWPSVTICACLAMTVAYFASKVIVESQIVATIGAFSIGLFGNIYYRLTGELTLVPLCSGMVLLTTGNIGVKGAFLLIQENNDGGTFAMEMVLGSLGIAVGLFAAALLPTFPKHKHRSINLSF